MKGHGSQIDKRCNEDRQEADKNRYSLVAEVRIRERAGYLACEGKGTVNHRSWSSGLINGLSGVKDGPIKI